MLSYFLLFVKFSASSHELLPAIAMAELLPADLAELLPADLADLLPADLADLLPADLASPISGTGLARYPGPG